jgi:hypothetical protein
MVEEQSLRAAPAARRLGIPTKELLRLVFERKIHDVMVEGSLTSRLRLWRGTAPRDRELSVPSGFEPQNVNSVANGKRRH